jgi:hypothetical protein
MPQETRAVSAKTADYTVTGSDNGATFTNRGSSATVTFTLPTTTSIGKGFWCEFFTVEAQSIAVASSPADTLIVHADATADSITTAATIGQHIRVVNDGTGWLVESNPSAASTATAVTAVTLATA